MNKVLLEKIKESVKAVLPLTIVVLIVLIALGFAFSEIALFGLGAVMLMLGLVLFGIGANESLLFLAEETGMYITSKRKLFLLIIVGIITGFLITVSEPGIWVLGEQFSSAVPKATLVFTVAVGVAIFIVVALLRIVFQVRLNIILSIIFAILFTFVCFIEQEMIPVAFDSGGLSSGPMAVPFIVALGIGISSGRGSRNEEDSFGMLGITSLGPVFAIFLLGLITKPVYSMSTDESSLLFDFLIIGLAILAFIIFFIIFQVSAFKLNKKRVIRVLIGFVLTYIGLIIFLTGANIGFVNVASALGEKIANFTNPFALVPFGLLFGFVIVSAEPSVIVLVGQVEEVTDGQINKKLLMPTLSIGVSLAIGLAMLRIVYDINILWILIPGYLIALVLTFFVPKIFTAIAFDSGAAVSGALASTFLVPFALGAAKVIYETDASKILSNGFGVISLVLLAPLVTIQFLGLIFKIKSKRLVTTVTEEEIIEMDEV